VVQMSKINIVLLGDGSVGKTAICYKFVNNEFIKRYDPTIEDSFRKEYVVDDEAYLLEIIDTAGTDQFTQARDMFIRVGNGFMLVYSITSLITMENLRPLHKRLCVVKSMEDVPIVVVGNKSDLVEERDVKKELGEEFAQDMGDSCRFFECSAKIHHNINEMFAEMVRLINKFNPPKKSRRAKEICVLL